jgi:Ca2+-binding EF-hand superfamily protein
VFAVAQCALLADAQSGRLRELFQVLDESGTGRVNREQFKTLVSSLGLQVTEQETLTLYRAFARRKEEVQYEKFIAGILSPTNDLN